MWRKNNHRGEVKKMAENTRKNWLRICGIFCVALCVFTIINQAFAGVVECLGYYEQQTMSCDGVSGGYATGSSVQCGCGSGYSGYKEYKCTNEGWNYITSTCVCNVCNTTDTVITDFTIAGGKRQDIKTTKSCKSGCECDSSCSGTTTAVSCKCDTGYVVVGSGKNCTCEKSATVGVCTPQYCNANYYVDVINNKCENCPYWGYGIDQDNDFGYSEANNTQGVKACYIKSGSEGEDDAGYFTLTGDCYHE